MKEFEKEFSVFIVKMKKIVKNVAWTLHKLNVGPQIIFNSYFKLKIMVETENERNS